MTERIMCRHIIADMLVNPAITHRPAHHPRPVPCCGSAFISYTLKISRRNCSNEPDSIGLPVSLL